MGGEMSHTPGPWEFVKDLWNSEEHSEDSPGSIWDIEDQMFIATIEYLDEVEDNARLIAAAPDLLDALKHIEEYWNRDQNETAMADALWHIIETAQAAIAKAEGDR
jgi:hypothetical protein